ncbi:MAG TPA: polyphenol oxidase family protein [Polyangiaceae bacterium]|nr:polyphenol oxidase family protein [Polyangiaceae bacterium]
MLLSSKLLADHGFAHAFPTRSEAEADLGAHLSAQVVVQVKQVHGGRAVEAAAADGTEADAIVARAGAAPRSTALALSDRGETVAVGVRVADCVPLLLADSRTGDVAAVHAGWRGVVAKIVPAAVDALGGGPLFAAIGPCIGACCFEVGRDVGAQIAEACGKGQVIVWGAQDKVYVDLRAAVRAQLRALGVSDAHIEDVPGCTKHEAARFHSYRRDGAGSGRMLAAIATRR